MTPSGAVTEFAASGPLAITAADGNLWFTEGSTNVIGRVNLH